jgi:MFS family permease
MAALMIPGGKLTDRWGRKRCFTAGLVVYGVGALLSAAAPGLGVLILGNSILEGVGTALLIPPVYILTTLLLTDLTSRARAFGVISAAGGVGGASGPLIGGLITEAISCRRGCSATGPRTSAWSPRTPSGCCQGEISGLSRSVSNLGSSLGTAIAGTILVAGITRTPERSYGLAMIVLAAVGLVGLAASLLLPRTPALANAAASRP